MVIYVKEEVNAHKDIIDNDELLQINECQTHCWEVKIV